MKKNNVFIIAVFSLVVIYSLSACNRGGGGSSNGSVVTTISPTSGGTATGQGKTTKTTKGSILPPPPKTGHFVFKKNGQLITRLDLMPGSINTITLENTGDKTITNAGKPILTAPNNALLTLTGDCLSATSLDPHQICILHYSVSADYKTPNISIDSFSLVATGSAENSPQTVKGSVAMVRAYVVNSATDSISQCVVMPATGEFSGCADAGATGLAAPQSIALNAEGNRAYIANFGNNMISRCDVDAESGRFSNCVYMKTPELPQGLHGPVAIRFFVDKYALIINGLDYSVSVCNFDKIAGEFSKCKNQLKNSSDPQDMLTSIESLGIFIVNKGDNSISLARGPGIKNTNIGLLNEPTSINAINSGTRSSSVYITNLGNDKVIQTTLDWGTGTFKPSLDSKATLLYKPTSIKFNSAERKGFITNAGDDTITACDIDEGDNFKFKDCEKTKAENLGQPMDLALHPTPVARAFVANNGKGTPQQSFISQCTVNLKTGMWSNCSMVDTPKEINVRSIAINPKGTIAFLMHWVQEVYIQKHGGEFITRCEINAKGEFTNCRDSEANKLDTPFYMVFNRSFTHALVSNNGGNIPITFCRVAPDGAMKNSCKDSGFRFISKASIQPSVDSIALTPDESLAFIGLTDKTMHVCDVDFVNGALNNCKGIISLNLQSSAKDIVLNRSGTRAYLVDYNGSKVYQCPVDMNRKVLGSCNDTKADHLHKPSWIHLNAAETRAFIVNSGDNTISQCSVNSSKGTFSNCSNTGATGFVTPDSIAVFPSFSIDWGYGSHR